MGRVARVVRREGGRQVNETIEGPATCSFDGHALVPCAPLEAAFDDGRKGLLRAHMFSIKDGFVFAGVQLCSGAFAKKGILIAFCPFCGTDIATAFEQKTQDRVLKAEATP